MCRHVSESVYERENSSSRGCSFFNKKCILGTLFNLYPHWIFLVSNLNIICRAHAPSTLGVRRGKKGNVLRQLKMLITIWESFFSSSCLLDHCWNKKGCLDIIKCKTSIQATIGPWRLYFFTGIMCNLNWDLIRECCVGARSEWG